VFLAAKPLPKEFLPCFTRFTAEADEDPAADDDGDGAAEPVRAPVSGVVEQPFSARTAVSKA
jgi:hypothetical protein